MTSSTCFHCNKEFLGSKKKCVLCTRLSSGLLLYVMNLYNYYKIIFVYIRKVLCISCWNGSKTCVIEVSECSKLLEESMGGAKVDELLLATNAQKEEEKMLQQEDENKAEEKKEAEKKEVMNGDF